MSTERLARIDAIEKELAATKVALASTPPLLVVSLRLLISAAEAQPEAVYAIHSAILAEAVRYLDRAILDKLNADFLVAILNCERAQQRYR